MDASDEGRSGHKGGDGWVKVYLHAVTDSQAALLTDAEKCSLLQEVRKRSGAEVEIDPNLSPVPGMKIVIIRGVASQIKAAVRLICQKTSAQRTLSSQAEAFWIQWVEDAFPDLDSRAYFLPPVYFNRMPKTRQSAAGQDVVELSSAPKPSVKQKWLVQRFGTLLALFKSHKELKKDDSNLNQPVTSAVAQTCSAQPAPVQQTNIRDDTAKQHVVFCLQKLAEKTREVLVGMSQLQIGRYLSEPCYSAAAAAAQLPRPDNLPPLSRNWAQGDFDVLLIHRHYGLVICEVKAFGDNLKELNMTQQDIDNNIRTKLKVAVTQLDKAEAMLSHLVSDIAPGLRITKTIAVPNLTGHQVQQAISSDPQLIEDLCRCLDTTNSAAITSLCLCSDQLCDLNTPCDVNENVLMKLENWWQLHVAVSGPDSQLTFDLYKKLIARFCGPATTVSVPCTSLPRLHVKTLGQVVPFTGQYYTALITLYPEQVDLFIRAPPRLFVAGPPGTGKTVALLLMGTEWLRCGHGIYIVSTSKNSRAACIMLYHLLLQTIETLNQLSTGETPGQPRLLDYMFDVRQDEDVEKAVNFLSKMAREESLYVIVDEVGDNFKIFCDKLLAQVPHLHLWAASCSRERVPDRWQVKYLTRSLRSPPAVIRELEEDMFISIGCRVHEYSRRGVPHHTDGPPVRRLYHRGRDHLGVWPVNCVTCGRAVASFLHSLRVGVTESVTTDSKKVTSISGSTTPPCLQWRDVLILDWDDVSDKSGMVMGLRTADIPVRAMTNDDTEDVATVRSDVVWVANGQRLRGLERKVVVCLERSVSGGVAQLNFSIRLRCALQLVIISR